MREVLIDGDWIVYTAGFAGQKSEYAYIYPKGQSIIKPNMTELREAVGPAFDEARVFGRVAVDPPEHVFHSAKMMITRAVEAVAERLGHGDLSPRIFLDGDGNFRQKLATIRPYKGNRAAPRPAMYQALRDYLLEHWGAELVHDQETDDALSIAVHQHGGPGKPPVVVGVDKDLLQIPALHYNPNKGFCKVTPELGELLAYRQCLAGDPTDNIGGCYKVGDKRARTLMTAGLPNYDKWVVVVSEYEYSIARYGRDLYRGLDAEEAALENMRLVWLRRFPGEMWTPPTAED